MAVIETKVELVYKTFHKTQNTKAKVQLLLFLFQSCTHLRGSISDRFYRVLYEFLNTNEILHCSISEMFFDLLLLSMKEDQNLNRTLAFIKKLLQLCFEAQSNFIVTCLILINKVIL
jgi:ribosome biogenesis protein MAK21